MPNILPTKYRVKIAFYRAKSFFRGAFSAGSEGVQKRSRLFSFLAGFVIASLILSISIYGWNLKSGAQGGETKISASTDATRVYYYNSGPNGAYNPSSIAWFPKFLDSTETIQLITSRQANPCGNDAENQRDIVVTNEAVYVLDQSPKTAPLPTSWLKVNPYPAGVTKFLGAYGLFGVDALLGDNGRLYSTTWAPGNDGTLKDQFTNAVFGSPDALLPNVTKDNIEGFTFSSYVAATCHVALYTLAYRDPSNLGVIKFLTFYNDGSFKLINNSSVWKIPDFPTTKKIKEISATIPIIIQFEGETKIWKSNQWNNPWYVEYDFSAEFNGDIVKDSLREEGSWMVFLLLDSSGNLIMKRVDYTSHNAYVYAMFKACYSSIAFVANSDDSPFTWNMMAGVNESLCANPADPPTTVPPSTGSGTTNNIINTYNYDYKGISIHTKAENLSAGYTNSATVKKGAGQKVRFTLTVSNADVAKQTEVKFTLPAGFTYAGNITYNGISGCTPSLPAIGSAGPMSWSGCNAPAGDSTIVFETNAP